MTKHEQKFQSLFKRWLQAGWTGQSAVFELKRTLTDTLPFSALKEHQIDGLLRAQGTGVYYKLSDETSSQKPFDCFFIRNAVGYVAIAYGPKLTSFYLIPINNWIKYTKTAKAKSLSRIGAESIASQVIHW